MFGDWYALGYEFAQKEILVEDSIETNIQSVDYFKERAIEGDDREGENSFLAGIAQGLWDKVCKELYVN